MTICEFCQAHARINQLIQTGHARNCASYNAEDEIELLEKEVLRLRTKVKKNDATHEECAKRSMKSFQDGWKDCKEYMQDQLACNQLRD